MNRRKVHDMQADINWGKYGERLTRDMLEAGWYGATDAFEHSEERFEFDFSCIFPTAFPMIGDRRALIDAKIVKPQKDGEVWACFFWETRSDTAPAWGTKRNLDLLFYWMPDRLSVIDVKRAGTLIDNYGRLKEQRLKDPSYMNGRIWWGYGYVVHQSIIQAAIVHSGPGYKKLEEEPVPPPTPEPEPEPEPELQPRLQL